MDQATILAILRHVLTIVGTIVVSHGYLNDGQYEQLAGAIITVAPVIWSILQKKQQKAAVVSAAATGVPVQASAVSPVTPPAVDVAAVAGKITS